MTDGARPGKSMLEDESALRWGFLEDDHDACAVVSDRMELVYMNDPARRLVSREWFGRRCFEIFPTANDVCAFHCPTIHAVHEAQEILYCEETLRGTDGPVRELGVAVIPLSFLEGRQGSGRDEARAVLVLRPKAEVSKEDLLARAGRLRETLTARFHADSHRVER